MRRAGWSATPAIRWSDVDLLQRILYVRRSIGSYDDPDERSGDETDTDVHSPVFVTVESKRGRDGRMRTTGRPLDPRMLTRVFRRYAERAGLPQSIRLHDLRHTAITNAIGQGEDITPRERAIEVEQNDGSGRVMSVERNPPNDNATRYYAPKYGRDPKHPAQL